MWPAPTPDSPDAEADGTKGSETGGEESSFADFRWSTQDTENGKGRREYLQAAKAAVEAAAKTVQSMIAALGAAGAVMVLLLVIIVGIIGGAAFSGSSESSEALSQEVLSYTSNHPEIRQPVWNPRIRLSDTGDHDAGIRRSGNRSHAEQ